MKRVEKTDYHGNEVKKLLLSFLRNVAAMGTDPKQRHLSTGMACKENRKAKTQNRLTLRREVCD